ncbi:MAG: hypothetical protein P8X74_24055 [Reinekea sp.]
MMPQYPIGAISDHKFDTEAPNINVKTSAKMRSSDGEFVRYVQDKHDRWLDFHSASRARMFDVLDAFLDINGGMWPARERQQLKSADRHIVSINIAKQKMETLNGSLTSERFDFDFKPLDIEENSNRSSIGITLIKISINIIWPIPRRIWPACCMRVYKGCLSITVSAVPVP